MTQIELIGIARERVAEIAKATKKCPSGHTTRIYQSENGVTVSHIQQQWETRTKAIDFGSGPMTKSQVQSALDRAQYYAELA